MVTGLIRPVNLLPQKFSEVSFDAENKLYLTSQNQVIPLKDQLFKKITTRWN